METLIAEPETGSLPKRRGRERRPTKKRVKVIVITETPDRKPIAAHMVENSERKRGRWAKWPGIHLSTFGTSVPGDSDDLDIAYRLIAKSLGRALEALIDDNKVRFARLIQRDELTIIGLFITEEAWHGVKPNDGRKPVIVSKEKLNKISTAKMHHKRRYHGKDGFVMFDGELEALRQAFTPPKTP